MGETPEERAKRFHDDYWGDHFGCADPCDLVTCISDEIRAAVAAEKKAKDQAYSERNRLVAYLASLFPSCLERHPEEDEWEDDWRWVVFIHHPQGQLSWHIHDSELPSFAHVPWGIGNVKWDGHTTEQKYERLAQEYSAIRAGEGEGEGDKYKSR